MCIQPSHFLPWESCQPSYLAALHWAAELPPMRRLGATPAMTWAFRLQRWASTGGCPGSHLSGFLCKPNRCSQQRNRNQTRKMRHLQKCFIGGWLLGTAGSAGAPCSRRDLPCCCLQPPQAASPARKHTVITAVIPGDITARWEKQLQQWLGVMLKKSSSYCVLNTNTLMENESALFGLFSRGPSD